MDKKIFPALCALLLILTLTAGALPVRASTVASTPTDLTSCADWPEAPEISSECAILMEARTGSILYAKNAEESCYPASVTKIMAALLTLENCSLDETVTFSYRATHDLEAGSTHIARTEGEELSVEDCLYAVLLASANEVAQALAEHVSGTIEDFADLMNERAQELGCTNTHFTNPTGLNDEEHLTTCLNMAIITRAAVQNSTYLQIGSTLTYTIPVTNKNDEEHPIAMKHQLVRDGADHYDGAVTGKTGYTTLAGNTLVTYAVREDMELICVIMKSDGTHYEDTVSLLDYGFDNFTMYQLCETDTSPVDEETARSSAALAEASISEDEWLVLPSTLDFSVLDTSLDVSGSETGTVGTIHYLYEGTELGSAALTVAAAESLPESEENEETGEAQTADTESTRKDGWLSRLRGGLTRLHSRLTRLPVLSSLSALPQVQNHPWLFWALPLVVLVLIILIILLLLSLRGGGGSRNRRRRPRSSRRHSSYGYLDRGHRGSRRRKGGNKYKMKL
ncbi:MAG: D-alanyl-D-alanine carboxypeptidase [Lachnospiraceae bacterium]|nr:D-alanyl-D-alanine carboxypeptidase [Lachnospiraceae bacterium]